MSEHTHTLATLDWLVIGGYLCAILGLALWLARSQHNRIDYFVAGRRIGAWPVALSVMATQCSTNSILGAPAFVAFAAGGGLVWLQYELAVPLAMIVLMLFILPRFRSLQLLSIYGFLEQRFDTRTRRVLSGLFLFVRAFATAVTVYGVALVIDLITGLGFVTSVLLLGAFTVLYDCMGGIRGVIYSDVIQLLILTAVLVLVLYTLVVDAGGAAALLDSFQPERRRALDFGGLGITDGQTFGFWPMLLGGLFLYVSYYGCDQSQVQRMLCTENARETNRALFINGLLRFPLVALYCAVGVGIGVYALNNPGFLGQLPATETGPEVNLAVPVYMMSSLPAGVVGLGLVALFAAAMSSLDSVINSLSASTMEDFIRPLRKNEWPEHQDIWWSRAVTAGWGGITVGMSFFVGDIAPTVLEAINKIGSLANGPVLAVFVLGFYSRSISGTGAITGLLLGMLCNGLCWLYLPDLSWLWWNPIGFAVAVIAASACQRLMPGRQPPARHEGDTDATDLPSLAPSQRRWSGLLALWFFVLLAALAVL